MTFDLGARYMTITHNCDNAWATAASTVTDGGEDKGLTEFGPELIKEMNRLGMLVDLSHVSHNTMRDVLKITDVPVMFSHSSAYAVSAHNRNVPDDVLKTVKKNNGVVMVTFVNSFLNITDPDSVDVNTAVEHIYHIAEVAGWDHVGIGGDYDGTDELPEGLEVSLTHVLLTPLALTDGLQKYRMYQRILISSSMFLTAVPRTNKSASLWERTFFAYGLKWKREAERFADLEYFPARRCGQDETGPNSHSISETSLIVPSLVSSFQSTDATDWHFASDGCRYAIYKSLASSIIVE